MRIYIGVNKNKTVSLHAVEPHRNETTGKWESLHPYVNSIVQHSIEDMIKHSTMTWEMEPEVIDISV